MNKEENSREKEIKYLMYVKSELIKEEKRQLKELRRELENLGNNKVKVKRKIR